MTTELDADSKPSGSNGLSQRYDIWSAPGLVLRSAILGLMIFMVTGVALVPLANRKLSGVFWVGAVVNLGLFCGVSLAVPIVLLRRMREHTRTRVRQVICILGYTLGWLLLPCIGLVLFANSESRIQLPSWQTPLLLGMIGAFLLVAAVTAMIPRRRVE